MNQRLGKESKGCEINFAEGDPLVRPSKGKKPFYGLCARTFSKRRGTILKRAKNVHICGGKTAHRGFFAIYGKIVPREMGGKRRVWGQFLRFLGKNERGGFKKD